MMLSGKKDSVLLRAHGLNTKNNSYAVRKSLGKKIHLIFCIFFKYKFY